MAARIGWFRRVVAQVAKTWGGARKGAGRPLLAGRRKVPHCTRDAHDGRYPVLITWRSVWGMLRTQYVFPVIRKAIAKTNRARNTEFRICQFSVQGNHIHVLAEADSSKALERGARSLAIRIAKSVNQIIFHRGRFFADRYHVLELRTARAVRNALVYVLGNFRKHQQRGPREVIDLYSSAPYFRGFAEFDGCPYESEPRLFPRSLGPPADWPIEAPRTWLLSRGWLECGRISVHEAPAGAR